ncbi:type IX secretion system sortase PorU [Balneola sp. MJW-20]|uniref:type IX secretion system sortase PorU n=1 Tax=Gracilimonas aurantiaca TaxID=3234185 RepID=UPI003465371C
MSNRLLLIGGLICFLFAPAAMAQQWKIVAETQTFRDYELLNEELRPLSPYSLTIPYSGGMDYQVLEQSVAEKDTLLSEESAMVMALPDRESPLIRVSEPGVYRDQRVRSLTINATRYSENSLSVVRRMKIRIYKSSNTVNITSSAELLADSPLSNGEWFKIPVRRNGIYQITTEYLEELGVNADDIDPRNIQIWGTGGFVLPELNSDPEPEFVQIPIIVSGQSDGSFDASDRIIFYANSPNQVQANNGLYVHDLHPYSETNFIFLTISNQPGRRLTPSNNGLNPSRTITGFDDLIWIDEELNKAEDRLKSGRFWLGQRFRANQNGIWTTVLQDTLPGINDSQPIRVTGELVGRSENSMNFSVRLNGTSVTSIGVPSIGNNGYNSNEYYAGIPRSFSTEVNTTVSDGILDLQVQMNHNEPNTEGFVNYIRLTLNRQLIAQNEHLYFYSPFDGIDTEVASYQLQGFNNEPVVMEVSNPVEPKLLNTSAVGNNYTVNYYSGTDLQFIAQSSFFQPEAGVRISNQNLRGIAGYPDYIIVTTDLFEEYAQDLADYRSAELTPVVVTQEQIFNEFSGGVTDPSAIRNYLKFLWDRAGIAGQPLPEYVLLFGDTTFDYKGIIPDAFTNHVLTYQSRESNHRTLSFATDDFFGFMNDDEGNLQSGTTSNSAFVDLGIGRIPAQTRAEAAAAIEKIRIYEDPANTGSWQNLFTFVADDDYPDIERNRDLHVLNADETASRMNISDPGLRIKKIYEFAYPSEISGAGRQVPEATDDLINTVNNGTLVLNYSGHGNEQTLSDEELFRSELIPRFTNRNRLCVLVTATCQFGRYDDIDAQSGAEKMLFAENGGIVSAFTTTRVVYTNSSIGANNNFGLNVALSQSMLIQNTDGSQVRLGDIYRNTKNFQIGNSIIVSGINSKKFILLGDPALKFRIPKERAALASLNDFNNSGQDTVIQVRALDQVDLSGELRDLQGNLLSGFNGEADITVFDAPRKVGLPERDWVLEERCNLEDCAYTTENDILFRGKAAVENGLFSTTFILPKDISNSDSLGRIVLFAQDNSITAGGSFDRVRFRGQNPDAINDGQGPSLDLYLNDERFVNGNLVSDSPKLVVELEDESGINTTGTGVGHEIIATIDTKPKQTIVLNEFYEGELNDYTRGRIEYPLDQIPDGSYTLNVRAWDVHNNPSEKSIFFEVASQDDLQIRSAYNYPNPMSNTTQFTFEHNQPGNPMDVSIRIYTLSGKPVQHLQESILTNSSYASISWNGRDRDYDRLGNGTYIYVLRVTADTPQGRKSTEKIEKLVIIR